MTHTARRLAALAALTVAGWCTAAALILGWVWRTPIDRGLS